MLKIGSSQDRASGGDGTLERQSLGEAHMSFGCMDPEGD